MDSMLENEFCVQHINRVGLSTDSLNSQWKDGIITQLCFSPLPAPKKAAVYDCCSTFHKPVLKPVSLARFLPFSKQEFFFSSSRWLVLIILWEATTYLSVQSLITLNSVGPPIINSIIQWEILTNRRNCIQLYRNQSPNAHISQVTKIKYEIESVLFPNHRSVHFWLKTYHIAF